ncbi:hypothetical protein LTR50_001294 [Elasticomyces elasticus]|nr:hypothetical protein LTR50_001294 [Elasticomyces elasticus]
MSTVSQTALQSSYPPILPNSFNANQPQTIRLYPLSNYTFGTKETQPEEDPSVIARLNRLQEHYAQHGMRRTPGDYLRPEDEEVSGFKARLNERLAPIGSQFSSDRHEGEWQIADTLAQWWRPNFETFMYPYIPAHCTRPKECKKLYMIQLPRSKVLSVPKNMKLLAVPLFELYDNTQRYGPQLSAIPHLLSRYNFEFVDETGNVVAVTPGGGPMAGADPALTTQILAGGENGVKQEGGAVKQEGDGDVKVEDES